MAEGKVKTGVQKTGKQACEERLERSVYLHCTSYHRAIDILYLAVYPECLV